MTSHALDPTLDENRSVDDLEEALRSLAQSPLNDEVRHRMREILDILDARARTGGLLAEMTAFGEWARLVRKERGFVWLGTMEADPRTPGPPALVWGRTRSNGLQVAVWTSFPPYVLEWKEITEEEWAESYPYATVPARLPDDYVEANRAED